MPNNPSMNIFRSRGSALTDSDGFSLIETIVALAIAAGVFLAFAAALISTLKGGMVARQNQQAADLMTQQIETIRNYPYAAASMVTSDLTGDPAIVSNKFNPGTGLEPIVAGTVGSVSPHIVTPSPVINGTVYNVASYITAPTDPGGAVVHRATVVVTWSGGGISHRKQFSTLLVNTVRGLPLPEFNMSATTAATDERTVGSSPTWGFKISNVGARDAWNLASSVGSYNYYNDNVDCDGSLDAGATQLTDTGGDGIIDTGLVEPNASLCVVAVRTTALQPTEAPGSFTVTFTATSVAQPLATSAVKSLSYTELCDVVPPGTYVPPGGTIDKYYLYNNVMGGLTNGTASTATIQEMGMSSANGAVPYATISTANYSTDVTDAYNVGRHLQGNGSDSSNQSSKLADWRTQTSKATTFTGTGLLQIWIACASGGTSTLFTLDAELGTSNNSSNFSAANTASATSVSCSSTWTQVSLPLSAISFSVSKNKYWAVRVWAPSNSAPTIRMMYDNHNYPALVYMPRTAP